MKVLQILVLIFGLVVIGNEQPSSLSGKAFDENGGLIPNIKIVVKSDKKKIHETTTDNEGRYFLKLPLGVYLIEIRHSLNHFCPIRIRNYSVVEAMSFDFVLEGRGTNSTCKSKVIKF